MNWLEYDKCIKYLNPKANYTIDGNLVVTWDFYHVGVKPSLEECLQVLPIVQAQMDDDLYANIREQLIQDEMQEMMRQLAIQQLIEKGVLDE